MTAPCPLCGGINSSNCYRCGLMVHHSLDGREQREPAA